MRLFLIDQPEFLEFEWSSQKSQPSAKGALAYRRRIKQLAAAEKKKESKAAEGAAAAKKKDEL